MAKKIPEIHIAVFGESGCGKTTLLSSYYGKQQSHEFEDIKGYALLAEDTSQGNALLANYYGMQEGYFPAKTGEFDAYPFTFHITGSDQPSLKIYWYDYPGGWWTSTPSDSEESQRRQKCLQQLLNSDVGILVVDGERFRQQGIPYLKKFLNQFKDEVQRQKKILQDNDLDINQYPTEWIIALSKADLYPNGYTAKEFQKEILKSANGMLDDLLRFTRYRIASKGNPSSLGKKFLLLSSAKGENSRVEDYKETLGLELIAPLAFVSKIEQQAKEASDGKIFDVLGAIFDGLGAVVNTVDALDDFLPKRAQLITSLLNALKVKNALEYGAGNMREKKKKSQGKKQILKDAAEAMVKELSSEKAKRLYYCNQSANPQ